MSIADKKFIKYGKLKALPHADDVRRFADHHFQVFEKIDGGNCQVRMIGTELVGGSKANYLKGTVLNKVDWFKKFNRWIRSNPSLYNLNGDTVLFGEWAGNHTIEYSPENADAFFLIDIFDMERRAFLDYDSAKERVQALNLEGIRCIPTLHRGKVDPDLVERLLAEPSDLYSGPKEGLVLKDYATGLRLKVYHPDFAEVIHSRGGKREYLTPTRFRKNIFHKIEENNASRLVTHADLVYAVRDDILHEEGVSISPDLIHSKLHEYLEQGKFYRAARFLTHS